MRQGLVDSRGRYLQVFCLFVILIFGMFLRLGTAAYTRVDRPVRNDAKYYVAYAWNLRTYGVYSLDFSKLIVPSALAPQPDAVRPPGYPWFLRALMQDRIDASFISRAAYVQAWTAGVTLLCSTLLAMELLGAWAGLAVGTLVAISPHQNIYVAYLLTETLYGASLMLALGAGVLALKVRRPRWRYLLACISGILFGLSCLIRPTLDQWVLILLLLLMLPPMRCFRREIIALALGFVLMMSPWWIRNELSLHRMSDPSKMLVTVQQGSYPDFMYEGRPETFGYPYRSDPVAAEAESSWANVLADLRVKFAQQPMAMLHWYLFGKIASFFSWTSQQGWGDMFESPVLRSPWLNEPVFIAIVSLMWGLYMPLITCGVLGTVVAFTPKTLALFGPLKTDGIRFLALLHLFAIGIHVAGAPFARYSVPFRPVTFLLAVFLVVWASRSYAAYKHGLTNGALSG
jgi:hypothetical protein